MEDYIEIGKVIKAFGIKGEVNIYSDTDFDRFSKGKKIYIDNKEYLIEKSRVNKNIYTVKFKGYDNINQILNLVNKLVYIHKSQQEKLKDKEYYFDDLIGLKIFNQNNELKGEVINILEVPQGHILEVNTKNGKKMVPFNKFFILEVKDIIIVNEIEGLF